LFYLGATDVGSSSGLTTAYLITKTIKKSKFHAIGFFNEADTLESSSALIYSRAKQTQSIYTQNGWHTTMLIKWWKLKTGDN